MKKIQILVFLIFGIYQASIANKIVAISFNDELIRKSEKVYYSDKSFLKIKSSAKWKGVFAEYKNLINLKNIVRYYSTRTDVTTLIIPFKSITDKNKNIAIYENKNNEFIIVLSETKYLKDGSLEFKQLNLQTKQSNNIIISVDGKVRNQNKVFEKFKFLSTTNLGDSLNVKDIYNQMKEKTSLTDEQINRGKLEMERAAANCTSLPYADCLNCSSNQCSNSWGCSIMCGAIGEGACIVIIAAGCL
jgi:hypothetical protein